MTDVTQLRKELIEALERAEIKTRSELLVTNAWRQTIAERDEALEILEYAISNLHSAKFMHNDACYTRNGFLICADENWYQRAQALLKKFSKK